MCSIRSIVNKYSLLYNIEYYILLYYFNNLINRLKCCSDLCETSCNFDVKFYTKIPKKKLYNIHSELTTCEKELIYSLGCEN